MTHMVEKAYGQRKEKKRTWLKQLTKRKKKKTHMVLPDTHLRRVVRVRRPWPHPHGAHERLARPGEVPLRELLVREAMPQYRRDRELPQRLPRNLVHVCVCVFSLFVAFCTIFAGSFRPCSPGFQTIFMVCLSFS